jgi:polysaccharide export outer membrane protein
LIAACLWPLAAGCAYTKAPPPGVADPSTYRVGPPDQLIITVLPEPALERAATVRPDGMISIDLIGDVAAGGRTPDEIAAEIQQRISRYKRSAQVTVAVVEAISNAVTVFGEVRSPGTIPITGETRVAEVLGSQGGPTIFARKAKIRVVRTDGHDTEIHPVNLAAIYKGDLSTNILLEAGDIVVVPPNGLALVGYAFQLLLFPFQGVMVPVGTAASLGAF